MANEGTKEDNERDSFVGNNFLLFADDGDVELSNTPFIALFFDVGATQ